MMTLRPLDDAQLAALFTDCRERSAHQPIDGGLEVAPPGFWRNHRREVVGSGDIDFEIARSVMRDWSHFPADWATAVPDGPTESHQQIAVVARCLGLTVTNVCRVADVTEHHSSDWATFTITYTTVDGHDMTGAERFRLSWDKTTDAVSYEVVSYSRPSSWLARFALPYVRGLQRRFAVESCDRVAALVKRRGKRSAPSKPAAQSVS